MSMAHGLEARVPFLDPNVIEAVMQIDPRHKFIHTGRPAEKHILRKAFEDLIPKEVCWRTKAMQCEGIGMTWVSELQSKCRKQVSDSAFESRFNLFPLNTPQTKEEFF